MAPEQNISIGDLKFDLNHFFRYIYGGFILCAIIILILPKQSTELYIALGGNNFQSNTFIIFLLTSIGTGFYAFYKVVISEFIIDRAHFFKPSFLCFHQNEDCTFKYLEGLINDKKHRLIAFRLIRDTDFNSSIKSNFYLRHSEIHVLYMTSTACIIGLLIRLTAWRLKQPCCDTWIWIAILSASIISFLSGLWADKKLCEDEYYYSKSNEKSIKTTLDNAKLS